MSNSDNGGFKTDYLISKKEEAYFRAANSIIIEKLTTVERSDSTTAYDHAVRTAMILESELDVKSPMILIVGLLHDILEDSDFSKKELKRKFGETITEMVCFVTRNYERVPQTDLEGLKMKVQQNRAMINSPFEARIVKCADRIDNLRSIRRIKPNDFRYGKIPYWIYETKVSILPLAKVTSKKAFRELKRLVELYEFNALAL